ncbi:MAG: ADP-ribosylglycohydrolase family protein [Spirochaetales bacterium]|nr:ADP-ribosylglycohydrolase family protein [Spirochaetales bacterium]
MTTSQLLSRYYRFFACADAVGKATEFMTPQDIKTNMGRISGLVDPSKSLTHPDLPIWAVTDDTEQNLWLLRRYLKDGKVSIENTVSELVKWIEGTGAVSKHYIGPSSLKALQGIQAGEDPLNAGINGTTCGGIMRAPAAVFASLLLGQDMDDCIYNALVCTHNNSVALESAYAYAYAIRLIIDNILAGRAELSTTDAILDNALQGCERGISKAPWTSASASLASRLQFLRQQSLQDWTEDTLKDFLYGVLGTGLPSYETAGAVFCFNMYTSDPVRIMLLCAETGGDTDTIGALASSLASLRDLDASLPQDMADTVINMNRLGDYIPEILG